MPVTVTFSEVTIGGSAVNNPTDYNWTNYDNYPDLDLTKSYRRINVIHYNASLRISLEVTALAQVVAGLPLIGENDLCYFPCPAYCE